MYIRAERKAMGRRPEVGNGEQRPRCNGGQRQFIAGGGMSIYTTFPLCLRKKRNEVKGFVYITLSHTSSNRTVALSRGTRWLATGGGMLTRINARGVSSPTHRRGSKS